jgi:hypothetical protein
MSHFNIALLNMQELSRFEVNTGPLVSLLTPALSKPAIPQCTGTRGQNREWEALMEWKERNPGMGHPQVGNEGHIQSI